MLVMRSVGFTSAIPRSAVSIGRKAGTYSFSACPCRGDALTTISAVARNSAEDQVHTRRDLQVRCSPDGPRSGPPIDLKNWFATPAPVASCLIVLTSFNRPLSVRSGDGRDHIEMDMTRLQRRISKRRAVQPPPYTPDYFDPHKILYPARLELCVRIRPQT